MAETRLSAIQGGVTDRACKTCRTRKVKCDRNWPRCDRCTARGDPCDFASLQPIPTAANPASQFPTFLTHSSSPAAEELRIAALEMRMAALEYKVAGISLRSPASTSSYTALSPELAEFSFESPPLPFGVDTLVAIKDNEKSNIIVPLPEQLRARFVNGLSPDEVAELYNFIVASTPLVFSPKVDPHNILSGGTVFLRGRRFGTGYGEIGEKSLDWRLALPELANALSIHLVKTFFQSCCSYLRVFDPFHDRLRYFCENIMTLDPGSQVAVAGFCAMGARASPHSALLGIAVQDPEGTPSIESIVAAGTRRERACRALMERSISKYQKYQLGDDATVENLQVTLLLMQMLIFAELHPRRSRSMALTGLAQFRDLQRAAEAGQLPIKELSALGLPLFVGDAVIAAYARKPPLIEQNDIVHYFNDVELNLPNFDTDCLNDILDEWLFKGQKKANERKHDEKRSSEDNKGPERASRDLHGIIDLGADAELEQMMTHDSLSKCTTILCCWLAQCQREFGTMASPAGSRSALPLATQIRRLWGAIDQVHSAVQRIQQLLVNIDYIPDGCRTADGCEQLHLRYDTRLDRDLADVVYLLHSLILQKVGNSPSITWDKTTHDIVKESEARVRRSLKLVAFYSQLYITSSDRHMTYHLIWQLELLPNWPDLALQRYGEIDGPASPSLELTETELDWLSKGMTVAAFYHPVAESRLYEFQIKRRQPRINQSQERNTTTTDSLSMAH